MSSMLIKGGRIVDPLQGIDRTANLLIEEGRITEITEECPEADQVIEAAGCVVCPGFIDIHMHEDYFDEAGGHMEKSMSRSALRMGVTLDIGGQCGDNHYPPDRILELADSEGAPVNIGLLVGHTFLRNEKGNVDKYKPVSSEKIAEMEASCRRYLEAGCLGVSFGVKYVPGTTEEEILPLIRLAGQSGKIVASHVRNDVDGVFAAADELAEMGRKGGVRVQFSHVGSMGGYGQMSELLKKIQGYRDEGVDMMCDCYPYDAFSTNIGATTYDDGFLESYRAGYDSILMVSGKYRGQRCTKEIFDEMRREEPQDETIGYFMKPEEIEMALMNPNVMLASDGVRDQGFGHPRASGTFPKFIKEYILTGKMSMLEGIAKMTTMPAERLNLKQKGNLMEGSDADITVFDPLKVTDKATYEDGQIPSEGFKAVIIGGKIALLDDEIICETCGRALRG